MEIEHAKLMVLRAAWEKITVETSRCRPVWQKLYAGAVSGRVVNAAVQIHGGYGFMDEYAVSRMYRDQKINEIGEGTTEIQHLVIVKCSGYDHITAGNITYCLSR